MKEFDPLILAALAGVVANRALTHNKTPEEIAAFAIAVAQATSAKLPSVESPPVWEAPARYEVDEIGELRARVEALESALNRKEAALSASSSTDS